MVRIVCPCKDCENKGCGPYHDKCEAYQKWVQENKEQKQKQKRDDVIRYSKGPSRYW